MRKWFEYGGIAASVVLIAFGIGSIVVGINGRSEVRNSLGQEFIVGSPDMTPAAIKAEAKEAGLTGDISFPSRSVAGQSIDTGAEARAFAQYMRIHALEATQGLAYSQMGRFAAKPGTPKQFLDKLGATSEEKYALTDPTTGQPVDNARRNIWVTETALSTALNTSFMAEQVSLFGIVTGVALLLTGIGFFILTLGGALKGRAVEAEKPAPAPLKATPIHS
jgi:hypothetical protein